MFPNPLLDAVPIHRPYPTRRGVPRPDPLQGLLRFERSYEDGSDIRASRTCPGVYPHLGGPLIEGQTTEDSRGSIQLGPYRFWITSRPSELLSAANRL